MSPDFVLVDRDKAGSKYHAPIQRSYGVGVACGSANVRNLVRVDESVAVGRYKRAACSRCWPGGRP